jgi:predicted RNA methylase
MRAQDRDALLDYYPTPHAVVDHCTAAIRRICDLRKAVIYDTSCGDGYFETSMGPDVTTRSSDIDPKCASATTVDFLTDAFQLESADQNKDLVFAFNPPFGHQNNLTRKFLQKMHSYSPRYICVILPVPTRPNIQWKIAGYITLHYEYLPSMSFTGPAGLDIPVVFAIFEFKEHVAWANPLPRAPVYKHPRVTRSPNKAPRPSCILARYCGAGAGAQYYYLGACGELYYWDYGKDIIGIKLDRPLHVLGNGTFTIIDLRNWDICPWAVVDTLHSGAMRYMNSRALRANFNTGDVARVIHGIAP